MEPFVFNKIEQSSFNRLEVEAVILFGSHAQGTARPMSDYDFGILVSDPAILFSADRRREIYDGLYDLLSGKIKKLVNIDIVFLKDASMELQSHAAKHGIPLYEQTPHSFARFRERVMDEYADFAPLRKIFTRAILSRIPQ